MGNSYCLANNSVNVQKLEKLTFKNNPWEITITESVLGEEFFKSQCIAQWQKGTNVVTGVGSHQKVHFCTLFMPKGCTLVS